MFSVWQAKQVGRSTISGIRLEFTSVFIQNHLSHGQPLSSKSQDNILQLNPYLKATIALIRFSQIQVFAV